LRLARPTHSNQYDNQRSWSGIGTVKQRLEASVKSFSSDEMIDTKWRDDVEGFGLETTVEY